MTVLSVVTVFAGLLLFSRFFEIDFLTGFGNLSLFLRGLIGILVMAYGLIGFAWFLNQPVHSAHHSKKEKP